MCVLCVYLPGQIAVPRRSQISLKWRKEWARLSSNVDWVLQFQSRGSKIHCFFTKKLNPWSVLILIFFSRKGFELSKRWKILYKERLKKHNFEPMKYFKKGLLLFIIITIILPRHAGLVRKCDRPAYWNKKHM